jgi:RHS repeat-associated protein
MMTNAANTNIAWQAKYDPFGASVTVTASPVNNQRLPGQWFQIEDGLAYNWHRTYDPTLGRYTQPDPLGFVDGPGIYNYANGNPLVGVDPTGLADIVGIGSHAFSRMQERGITWGAVKDACACPISITLQPNGNTLYKGAMCSAVLSPKGWLVTVY